MEPRPAKRLKAALEPNVFAQFTALAVQHGAANLGQGDPEDVCFEPFSRPKTIRKPSETKPNAG